MNFAQWKRRNQVIFIITFTLVAVVGIITATLFRDRTLESRARASQEKENINNPVDFEGAPWIVNVPPSSAAVGSEFRYELQIVDTDTAMEDIRVRIVQAPSWLRLESGPAAVGLVGQGSSNIERVVLEVSDGEKSTQKSFYLLITENE